MEILDNLNGGLSLKNSVLTLRLSEQLKLSMWWTKPWSYFMTPAPSKRHIMMPIKLQGHQLLDLIRMFWCRCKLYWLNRTDPKGKLEKNLFLIAGNQLDPIPIFWKRSLSLHSSTKVGGGRRGGGPREWTSATNTRADGYSQLHNSDWLIQSH